jgi:hypothetical protein
MELVREITAPAIQTINESRCRRSVEAGIDHYVTAATPGDLSNVNERAFTNGAFLPKDGLDYRIQRPLVVGHKEGILPVRAVGN